MKQIFRLPAILALALPILSCSKLHRELAFTETNIKMAPGQTFQLKMTVDGKAYDLRWGSPESKTSKPLNISLTSEENSVASVDSKGLVTAISPGTAKITASAKGCTPATVSVRVQSSAELAPEITLGSFNLWVHGTGTDEWAWNLRRPHLAQAFIDNNFDILGVQEADATIRNELPGLVRAAGRNYEWWFVCRDSQDATSGEAVGIVYDPDMFTLSDKSYFWLSPTPDILSYGWDETKYHRVCACAKVTVKANGAKFWMMATHGPLGDEASANSAQIYLSKARELMQKETLPCILVGDMNSHPTEPLAKGLLELWNDPVKSIEESHRFGPRGTFNSHDINRKMDSDNYRIDYIFYTGSPTKIYVKEYRCNDKKYHTTADIYPSDHLPISVTVKFL